MRFAALLMTLSTLWATAVHAACSDQRGKLVPPRFIVSHGEVYDKKTALTWDRCRVGMSWNGENCVGTQRFLSLDEAVEAATQRGKRWRVPTAKELSTILDASCGRPAIDTKLFPDISSIDEESPYWTSSEVGMADLFYYIDFADGEIDGHTRGFSLAARLVRDGR